LSFQNKIKTDFAADYSYAPFAQRFQSAVASIGASSELPELQRQRNCSEIARRLLSSER